MTDVLKNLEKTLEEINNEYGQDKPVRIHQKTLDKNGFHFEFDSIFGFASYVEEDGRHMTILISEDDDFWFIPFRENKSHVINKKIPYYFASAWLKSLVTAGERSYNHYKIITSHEKK